MDAFVATLDAPAIGGLGFRRLRDAADHAEMAAVHSASQEWDAVDPSSARESVPTPEDIAQTFPEAQMRDHPDLLLATIDGRIVGYNHTLWRWTEVTGTRVYLHLGYLLPAWRGQGIGRAMVRGAQARIREIAAEEQWSGPAMLATNVSSTEREADRLMQNEGYDVVRRLSDMVLEPIEDLPAVALPEGVSRRLVQPEHYHAIYTAWKDAFVKLWTSTPDSEEDYQAFLAQNVHTPEFDPALCQVAWAGDRVVGLVWCHVHNGIATFPEVAVRPDWQRRGIARSLMVDALQALRGRGVRQARLYTDADDGQGARSLYERLGFREVKQHKFYRKPLIVGAANGVGNDD